jgi:chromosome partitioning protein
MIILVGNQKGGCGKSTTACNIAGILVNNGKDVMLVDADRQITTSLWVAERKSSYPKQPKINSMQKYGEVDDALVDLDHRYQYVIVDAAGHDSSELRSALTVCDVLLMPFRPSQPDLATLPVMSLLIKTSKRVNPKIKVFAFVNSAPTNTQDKDSDFAREAIAGVSDINLLSTTVYDRRIYRDGMAEGLAVIEMPDKSSSAITAKGEMKKILAEILNEVF